MKHISPLLVGTILTGMLLLRGSAVGPPQYVEQTNDGKQKWDQLGITNYHIVMKFYENFANGLETQRDVVVKGGKVITSSCGPQFCPAFVFTSVETVDDLFWVAQGGTLPEATYKKTPDPGSSLDECLRSISFDLIYGFPNYVSIDCPEWADEDNWVKVVSFEVIK
jgi:hypothetical protein